MFNNFATASLGRDTRVIECNTIRFELHVSEQMVKKVLGGPVLYIPYIPYKHTHTYTCMYAYQV